MRFPSIVTPLIWVCLTGSLGAADKPMVVALWPGRAPDEVDGIGDELVRMSPKLDRKQVEVTESTRLVTNVTKPTIAVYRPKKDKDTGTAVLICPGGGYWNLFWDLEGEEVAACLNVALRGISRGELSALEFGGSQAIRSVDFALQRDNPGRLDSLAPHPFVHEFAIAAVEADDMRTLMMLEEICDPSGWLLRVLASENFEIGVLEHHTAISGTKRLNRVARFPSGGMRRIRRELKTHRFVPLGSRGKIVNRNADVIDVIDVQGRFRSTKHTYRASAQ